MAGDENSIARMCLLALARSDALSQHFTPTAFGCRNLHVLVRVRELAEDETHQKTEEEEELVLRCTSAGDPEGSAFSLKINKSDRIEDLQLAVKRLKYEHRVEVHVDSLYLYPTLDWPEHRIEGVKKESKTYRQRWIRQKLDPGRMIGDVFQSIEQGCIHVLVIPPQTFHFAQKQKQEYLLPYQETGRRLKNAFEVVQIVRTVKKYSNIDTTRSNHARLPPFVLLPGSMGVGKTQMAFNLMARDDVEVFYIPCSKLEWTFTDRYDAFDDCVAKDILELPGCFVDPRNADVATISKQPRMYMYGFIWALVSGVSVFTGPRTRDEVVDALKAWRLKSRGKCCVFFLDNFPCLQRYGREWWVLKLGLMRNVFRSVGLVVLISADHISVSDMIEAVVHEHGDSLWSVVFPTFPRFQDPILSCVRPDLGVIIKKSRPLFAKKALEYMQANSLEDDTDLATYMDNMAGKLVKRDILKMTTRGENEFYGAQYSVFFNSSYSRTRGGVRIFNHYECLRETEPFKLWIHHGHVVKSKSNWLDWFVVLNCLPLPEEDALFHLSMTGGKDMSAFLDCRSNPQASYYEARYFASRCCSLNASSDGAVRQEAEMCGALVVASRHNGFAGSSFPSFFSRLLYEVEMQKSSEVQVRFPNEVLGFLSCLTVPFLAPSDVKWPAFLLQTSLNLGTLSRLTRKDRVDVSFMDGKVTAESLSPNASLPKSSLMRLLKAIPSKSVVHLVVTHSLQPRYLNSRKRDENGNVVIEDFQRKHLPKSLRSAHFYRIGVKLSPKETDASGKLWRNDLTEVRGLSNEDIEGGVTKVVIFVEVDRSKKQQKQQLEAEKKRERETKQELEANAEKKRKLQ